MAKAIDVTCNDCYFRGEGLCALSGDHPCPTFRGAGTLSPPRQAPLVLRPVTVPAARVTVAA